MGILHLKGFGRILKYAFKIFRIWRTDKNQYGTFIHIHSLYKNGLLFFVFLVLFFFFVIVCLFVCLFVCLIVVVIPKAS